jgi:hypothetical protein
MIISFFEKMFLILGNSYTPENLSQIHEKCQEPRMKLVGKISK